MTDTASRVSNGSIWPIVAGDLKDIQRRRQHPRANVPIVRFRSHRD
jgi:hypothetical protein